MQGDKIIIEAHHASAGKKIVEIILPRILATNRKYTINVAGESGSGKSEIAAAISRALQEEGILSVILQQDDYFLYPPKTNDLTRREDISWVGPQEVHLDLLDSNLESFLDGRPEIKKPLVHYDEDKITNEIIKVKDAKIAIAEGTYTALLKHLNTRTFIDRNYIDTMAHRQKRLRHLSELDDFTTKVLKIENKIIAPHKKLADLIVTQAYDIETQSGS